MTFVQDTSTSDQVRFKASSAIAKEVLQAQADALSDLANTMNGGFEKTVRLIMGTTGRVVMAGVGKSGIVGRKIAATLASTGTPSFFLHATEAFHGDLGMVTKDDVVVLISQSGKTEETLKLVSPLKRTGVPLIALTGDPASPLGQLCDAVLHVKVAREVCPNNLAPTTSTTCAMALGDALAVALMHVREFSSEDFAKFHPGGALGRRLAIVSEVMRTQDLPVCGPDAPLADILNQITKGRVGLTVVVDNSRIVGVVSDGDLRRAMGTGLDIAAIKAADLMSTAPLRASPDERIGAVEERMKHAKVKTLLVSADGVTLDGVLDLYDL
jgi:arabinose-5-phosphate isomerase